MMTRKEFDALTEDEVRALIRQRTELFGEQVAEVHALQAYFARRFGMAPGELGMLDALRPESGQE
jgi:hypothetical protein